MSELDLISSHVQTRLENLLKDLNISDYTLNISHGSQKSDNFSGVLAKVNVRRKTKSGSETALDLVVKSAPTSDSYRMIFPLVHLMYEREIYLYNTVLPEYTKVQEEKRIEDAFTSFPKFYTSSMDRLAEAIVMENMDAKGFKMLSKYEPVDYKHALIVLRNYGKLHALSFAIKDQNPKLFEEWGRNTRELLKTDATVSKELEGYWQQQFDRTLSMFDPVKDGVALDKLKNLQNTLKDRINTAVKSEEAGEYGVIGHGDGWINNFLFKYADSENPTVPTEVCFLDWQLSRLGSPALDLGYFIFTCTDKELRDEHYLHLIDEYYNTLCSFLRELGSDPEKLFPYEVLKQHLKKFSVYGLFMAVMILYFISSDNDEIPDMNTIQDMEDAKKKFSYVSKNIDKYRSRIRGVVLDFIKYDYDF